MGVGSMLSRPSHNLNKNGRVATSRDTGVTNQDLGASREVTNQDLGASHEVTRG